MRTHSKWHVGYVTNSYTPWMRGFDSSYGFFASGVDYNTKCSYKAAPPTDTSAYAWCRTVPHASGDGTTHHLYDWFAHNVFADDQQQPAYFSPGRPKKKGGGVSSLQKQADISEMSTKIKEMAKAIEACEQRAQALQVSANALPAACEMLMRVQKGLANKKVLPALPEGLMEPPKADAEEDAEEDKKARRGAAHGWAVLLAIALGGGVEEFREAEDRSLGSKWAAARGG